MHLATGKSMILICAALLSACAATYISKDAGKFAPDQLATLEHEDPAHSGVLIEHIDGEWRGVGIISTYTLSPGQHSIGVRTMPPYRSERYTRYFVVKPGRHYALKYEYAYGDRWRYWIVDAETGEQADF